MSSSTNTELESYLPVYDTIPDKWEEARSFIVEQLKKITNSLNVKEIGFYLEEELLSGKQFIPGTENPQEFRSIFRKLIDFGSLPNAGIKSVPHGITVDNRFTLIHLYASATDPVGLKALSIPFASPIINQNIKLDMDAVNVNITTAIDYSSYTRTFIVLEYIQEL